MLVVRIGLCAYSELNQAVFHESEVPSENINLAKPVVSPQSICVQRAGDAYACLTVYFINFSRFVLR